MSQRINVSSLGFSLTKEVPSTVEEYNALAPKRENAVLEDAINNTLYRGTLAEFRGALLEELSTLTGVERGIVKPATSEEADDAVYESEGKWWKRILASKGITKNEDIPSEWTVIAQRIMDAAGFDPSAKERSSDGPAIGKKDLAMADELIKRGPEKVAQVAAQLAAKLSTPEAAREVKIDFADDDAGKLSLRKSLGRAFADYRRKKEAELAAASKSEFAL
jgi:hypothetical protein